MNFRGSVRGTLHWRQRSAARTCQEKCPPAPTTSIFPLVGLKIALKIGVLRTRSASGIRVCQFEGVCEFLENFRRIAPVPSSSYAKVSMGHILWAS